MLHDDRKYKIVDFSSPEELAHVLKDISSNVPNMGFRIGDLLFLNESLSKDEMPEWMVFKIISETSGRAEIKMVDRLAIMGMTEEEVSSFIHMVQSKIWPNDIYTEAFVIGLEVTK